MGDRYHTQLISASSPTYSGVGTSKKILGEETSIDTGQD